MTKSDDLGFNLIPLYKFIMFSFICVILCSCSVFENYERIEQNLYEKFGENFTVTNTYRENNIKYAACKDENGNYYRFPVDKNGQTFFDLHEEFTKDQEIRGKIEHLISGDFVLLVQSNINTQSEVCDIFLYTNSKIDLKTLLANIYYIDGVGNKEIYIHNATIASSEDMEKFKKLFEEQLAKYGFINKDAEILISQKFKDYAINHVEVRK